MGKLVEGYGYSGKTDPLGCVGHERCHLCHPAVLLGRCYNPRIGDTGGLEKLVGRVVPMGKVDSGRRGVSVTLVGEVSVFHYYIASPTHPALRPLTFPQAHGWWVPGFLWLPPDGETRLCTVPHTSCGISPDPQDTCSVLCGLRSILGSECFGRNIPQEEQ